MAESDSRGQGPYISILLVSYHSRQDLERCLPSLFEQVDKPSVATEIIVVDNAPGDGTAAWLATEYPTVKVIANPKNTGYAGGNNLGLAHARGEWVLILNPDTVMHANSLKVLLEAAAQHPDALLTPKLLCPDGTVNACGLEMHYTGLTTCRGLGAEPERYESTHPVLLASGAALLARREVIKTLGGFDETYFMYLEDVDLSLRARLQGHDIYCVADAVVTHHYTLDMNPKKFFYLERNRLLTLFKIYQSGTLRAMVPALLLTEAATWAFALLKGPSYLRARLHALVSVCRARPAQRELRGELQRKRRVADDVLLQQSLTNLPLEQLLRPSPLTVLLQGLSRPVYQLSRPRPNAQQG